MPCMVVRVPFGGWSEVNAHDRKVRANHLDLRDRVDLSVLFRLKLANVAVSSVLRFEAGNELREPLEVREGVLRRPDQPAEVRYDPNRYGHCSRYFAP